jgi:ABC-type Fe3+/spermidine/putrescine transport system ATPase subunit
MDFEFIREQTPLYVEAAKLTLSFSMQKGEVVIVGPSGCGDYVKIRLS